LVFAVFTIRVLKNPKYQGKASNAAIFSPVATFIYAHIYFLAMRF